MKIIYEFDTNKEDYDEGELLLFQNASRMHNALFEISNILRGYRKGHKEEDFDKLDDEIGEQIMASRIDEIP